MSSRMPHVAIWAETTGEFGRDIMRGVVRYTRSHGPWTLFVDHGPGLDPEPLKRWRGDGLIARVRSDAVADYLRELPMPMVLIDRGLADRPTKLPPAATLQAFSARRSAELALQHFLDRGLKELAFCHFPDVSRGRGLEAHFAELAAARGLACDIYRGVRPDIEGAGPNEQMEDLAEWAGSLRRPCGVWCANDLRGLQMLEACRMAGVPVPEEMAVLGYNGDPLLCELATPRLSTVNMPHEPVGYAAAAALDQLMRGRSPAPPDPPLPVEHIIPRRSTDITASERPEVAQALRFIRERFSRGIGVEDVLDRVAVSRSSLDRWCRAEIGRTVHEELDRVRFEHARRLVETTNLKIAEIARRSGYARTAGLNDAFRRHLEATPIQLRRRLGRSA